jgi:death-on-curing protein
VRWRPPEVAPSSGQAPTKAATLLQSIVKNHALVDRNKRLGWLATAVFPELNGVEVTRIPSDDVYRFVTDVTAGNHAVRRWTSTSRPTCSDRL